MPGQELPINPVGKMNRRDPRAFLDQSEVYIRENMQVIGTKNNRQNRKVPGSERWTSSALTNPYTWVARYYSGNTRKTFAFSNGRIYHIANDGTATQKVGSLEKTARPCSEIFKVSGNNVMYFVDGFNGMYSHDGNIGHEWNKENSVTNNFVFIISHLDRMFAFEEDSEDLYFSKNLDPVNFTDSTDAGLITIGAKRGSKIQALILLNETLYIVKEDGWYVLQGRTPSEFRVREIPGVPGTPARWSVRNVEQGCIFMDQDYEFREFGGVSSKILSYNVAIGGDKTKNLIPIINPNKVENAVSVFHNNIYRCSFTESGKTTNNLEYCIDTTNLVDFFTRGNNVNAYSAHDKKPDDNELVTARADTGLLMYQYRERNFDHDDASSCMAIKLESYVNAGINNARYKRLWANVVVLGADAITVKTQVDTRLADSNSSSSEFTPQGETKAITNFLRVNNQSNVTDRIVLPWSNSKGQVLKIALDQEKRDLDVSLVSWVLEAIVKEKKRSRHVGV